MVEVSIVMPLLHVRMAFRGHDVFPTLQSFI